jgi:hypothetical protein
MVHSSGAVSDPNLPAPNMSKNNHRRQAPIMLVRHCVGFNALKGRAAAPAWPGRGNDQIGGPVMLLGNDGRRTGMP